MDNRFIGSVGSYILAVIIIACGIGGLVYFNIPVVEPEPELIDITPDNGYNWENLTDGMFVKLEANNIGGYYAFELDENGDPVEKYYLVYNYSQKTNSYDHMICVYASPYEYKRFDDLGNQVLSPKKAMKTYTTQNYVHKMTNEQYKELRNDLLIEGFDDLDEIEKLVLPYYIGPKVEAPGKPPIIKYASIIAIGLGIIMLIASIVGTIINRY